MIVQNSQNKPNGFWLSYALHSEAQINTLPVDEIILLGKIFSLFRSSHKALEVN